MTVFKSTRWMKNSDLLKRVFVTSSDTHLLTTALFNIIIGMVIQLLGPIYSLDITRNMKKGLSSLSHYMHTMAQNPNWLPSKKMINHGSPTVSR